MEMLAVGLLDATVSRRVIPPRTARGAVSMVVSEEVHSVSASRPALFLFETFVVDGW